MRPVLRPGVNPAAFRRGLYTAGARCVAGGAVRRDAGGARPGPFRAGAGRCRARKGTPGMGWATAFSLPWRRKHSVRLGSFRVFSCRAPPFASPGRAPAGGDDAWVVWTEPPDGAVSCHRVVLAWRGDSRWVGAPRATHRVAPTGTIAGADPKSASGTVAACPAREDSGAAGPRRRHVAGIRRGPGGGCACHIHTCRTVLSRDG